MWKRDEVVRQPVVPAGDPAAAAAATPATRQETKAATSQAGRDVVSIGQSVVIKGELNCSEDLTIEGHVEGRIELHDHVLTIGPNGKIKAELFAKSVVVIGEVIGNVIATEKIDIRENGSVEGDITSPRVAIAEGAHFRGTVDMATKGKAAAGPRPAEVKSQPAPSSQPAAQQAQRAG